MPQEGKCRSNCNKSKDGISGVACVSAGVCEATGECRGYYCGLTDTEVPISAIVVTRGDGPIMEITRVPNESLGICETSHRTLRAL